MSYYDQYNTRNAQSTYPQPHQYADQADGAYNPYDNAQPHQTYEQAGYGYSDGAYGGYRDDPAGASETLPRKSEANVYENEAYVPSTRALEPKSRRAIRRWRNEHQGNIWTRGSPLRCCARFTFCILLTFVFLFLSIVLSLVLWIQPPDIEIGTVTPQAGSPVQLKQNPLGVTLNLGVPVAVNNPNYLSVKFDSIDAQIFYPINNTQVGSGTLKNLEITSHKQTNFTLPFSLDYTTTEDPNYAILNDIANRCGFTGNPRSDINVDYTLHLSFKVLFIPIKPTIRNSASFTCPVTEQDIAALLNAAGIPVNGLAKLIKLFA